jgi:hypothetical protein
MPYPDSGIPAYTGPSSQFPTGPLSQLEQRGANAMHAETPGSVAGELRALLAAGGFNEKSSGIGANTDHQA